MLSKSLDKNPKYKCELCKIETSNKKDYNKHLDTRKHKNNNILTNVNKYSPEQSTQHNCSICSKGYKSRVGLWYHKKKCKPINDDLDKPDPITTTNEQLILELLAKNKELMEILILQNKDLQNREPTTINQTNNNNNQKFNINLFLNETCKDAINFSDFIKNIQISYEDLENNAQLGFVDGISKIFLDNLKQLGINQRPIHCTDVKRETMYIKDEDKWTKETDDTKLHNAIKQFLIEVWESCPTGKKKTQITRIVIQSSLINVWIFNEIRSQATNVVFTILK